MADASEASALAGAPTESLANLHLDEVTGEKVSKSELKKREKARAKEKAKKEKEAAAPPKPVSAKKSNAEADEKELNPNVRSAVLCALRQTDSGVAIFRDSIPQHQ
jgi:lysyl-tRNA synthetase class 2